LSRRNNLERLGAARNENSPGGVKQGFDFSFVSPTTFVELPSGGKYYPENHPLHGVESVEIKEMTAHEEDILADANLQKSGVAINKMIQNIVVDKRINTDSLLVGDKNAITIAARMHGYGADYKTSVSCPSCGTKNEHEFDLRSLEHKESVLDNEVSHVEGRIFQFKLPRTDFNVRVKLLNSKEALQMNKSVQKARSGRANANLQTTFLKIVLHSVQNKADDLWYEDRPVIEKFADSIPAVDAMYIRAQYKQLAPDMNMAQDFECAECGFSQEMEVPLNADFFWPDARI